MNRTFPALLLFALACFCNKQAEAGKKLRVYFIGNSYTHTNNMPQMIASIAASMGDTLVYEEHTPGGWTLDDHWNPPTDPCVNKIKTGNWDYVVLQEQSQLPAFGVLNPSHPTYIYAGQFTKLIRDSAICTTPMFFMTWGYKNGDPNNCPSLPYMCTYFSMDSVLRMRYLELTDSFNAVVSPAGAVRRYIRQHHPGIELYVPDGSHPSMAGTYAAACCFYAAMFQKDPTPVSFNSSLSSADAMNIKAAAKTVVYDSLTKWGIGVNDLSAAYTYSISGGQVNFINKSSQKMQNHNWNFGDGNTSTVKDPVHTYTTPGVYTVTLIATDLNGCSKIVSNKIDLLSMGINDITYEQFTITPNPATDDITIVSGNQTRHFNIRITNAMGKTVYLAPANASGATKISLTSFGSGMYYITLSSDAGVLQHGKFIKQ